MIFFSFFFVLFIQLHNIIIKLYYTQKLYNILKFIILLLKVKEENSNFARKEEREEECEGDGNSESKSNNKGKCSSKDNSKGNRVYYLLAAHLLKKYSNCILLRSLSRVRINIDLVREIVPRPGITTRSQINSILVSSFSKVSLILVIIVGEIGRKSNLL